MNIATIIAAFCRCPRLPGHGRAGALIYLTVFQNMAQLDAQGMNLLFFCPSPPCPSPPSRQNKLVEGRWSLPSVLCGLIGVPVGSLDCREAGVPAPFQGVCSLPHLHRLPGALFQKAAGRSPAK